MLIADWRQSGSAGSPGGYGITDMQYVEHNKEFPLWDYALNIEVHLMI